MKQLAVILGLMVLLAVPAVAIAQYDYPSGGSSGPPMGGSPPSTGNNGGMTVSGPSNIDMPPVNMPSVNMPSVNVPSVDMPSVNMPSLGGDDGSVTIVDFAFQPHMVSVPAGSTVSWENSGAAPHTVTSDTGAFDSGTIGSGGGFSETFNDPGMYTYHCSIHPNMTGLVQVSAT
jgi:plastocyanin